MADLEETYTPLCLDAVLCRSELEPAGLLLLENDLLHSRDVVGLLPGLEPKCEFMPPDLLEGSEPFVIFIILSLGIFYSKKKPGYL